MDFRDDHQKNRDADAMKTWLQTKAYRCPRCGASYLHDKSYEHHGFLCPFRPSAVKERLLVLGKTYTPTIGR